MNELYRCSNCRQEMKAISLDSVPDEYKSKVLIMMKAFEEYLKYDTKNTALIGYCKKCNSYSGIITEFF